MRGFGGMCERMLNLAGYESFLPYPDLPCVLVIKAQQMSVPADMLPASVPAIGDFHDKLRRICDGSVGLEDTRQPPDRTDPVFLFFASAKVTKPLVTVLNDKELTTKESRVAPVLTHHDPPDFTVRGRVYNCKMGIESATVVNKGHG